MHLRIQERLLVKMIATILKYATGQPQTITEWMRFVNIVELRTSIYKTRFLLGPFYYSPFVNLVKQVLHDIEWSNLLKYKSDYTLYQQIYYLTGTFRGMIDPIYLSREFGRIFTTSGVPDYTMNVTSDTPMAFMPLDEPWSAWEQCHPVRIIHHDSLELVTDLNKFSIEFKGKTPSRLVCSIDLTMLIFKYLKFMQYSQETDDDDSIEAYIQKHIVSHWFTDLRNIWLFNTLNELMFSSRFEPSKFTADNTIAPMSALSGAISDIYKIQSEVQQKNVLYGEVLATEWFGMRHSLKEWLTTIRNQLQVPNLRQYTYLKFLEEIPYASFVIRLNNMIGSRASANVNRELYQLLKRYHDTNVYASIVHSELKEKLMYEVGQLLALAKEYQSH